MVAMLEWFNEARSFASPLKTSHPVGIIGKGPRQNFDGHLAAEIDIFGSIVPHPYLPCQVRDDLEGAKLDSKHRLAFILLHNAAITSSAYSLTR